MSPLKKNRRWIWFFVVVFAMALAATVVLITFNLQQQLKPEQLAAARKLWKQSGPKAYTMSYTTRVNEENDANTYWVKVRGGQVVEGRFNGQPEAAQLLPYRGMEGLFDIIERYMKIDSEPGSPKVYVRAIFDDLKTGGVQWYVRRVMGTRQREEIKIETFTIDGP